MSDLIKTNKLANNPDFKIKIRIAALKYTPFVLDNQERSQEHPYFNHILRAPLDEGWITPLCYVAAQNSTLFAATDEEGVNSSSDMDIQYTVETEIQRFSNPA